MLPRGAFDGSAGDLYPSKEALDAAIASGSTGGYSETFEQLDQLLVTFL
jgi:hypothetical protein